MKADKKKILLLLLPVAKSLLDRAEEDAKKSKKSKLGFSKLLLPFAALGGWAFWRNRSGQPVMPDSLKDVITKSKDEPDE